MALGRPDKPGLAPEPVLESRYISHLSTASALYLSNPEETCEDIQNGLLASRVDNYLTLLESPEAMTLGLSQLLQKIEAHDANQPTGEEVRAQGAAGRSEKDPRAMEWGGGGGCSSRAHVPCEASLASELILGRLECLGHQNWVFRC